MRQSSGGATVVRRAHGPSAQACRHAIQAEAEARKERFLAYRTPETFVTSLSALVDTLEQAIHSREAGRDGVASPSTTSPA